MSQNFPTVGGNSLPQIQDQIDEKQNVALMSNPSRGSPSHSKKVNDDIEAAAFNKPANVEPVFPNDKTQDQNSLTAGEGDKLTASQNAIKESKQGCFGKKGLIYNIFNGGSTLMSYSASTLQIHETRSEQPKVNTTVVNTSCWSFIIIVFLALISMTVIQTVGSFKNVVLTEEKEIEQTMVLDQTTFPLHNFLKFGSLDDLKIRIGSVLYSQSQASSSLRRRRHLQTAGIANALTFDTCISSSAQNYFDATSEVCYTCPDYYVADTSALNCIQNTCAEEQIYAKDGACQSCETYFRANSDYTECINDLATCSASQILTSSGLCTNCQSNFRANSEKKTCINDLASCSLTQFLSAEGYCTNCNNQFRASDDKLKCIQDSCSTTQYLTADGFCISCAANSRGNGDKTVCINDKNSCTNTQILSSDGYCTTCDSNFRGDESKIACINDKDSCSDTQILSSDGFCTDCGALLRANDDKTICINDIQSCSTIQKLSAIGYCVDCDPYFRANTDKSDCLSDTCEVRETKDITGVCSECADYTYPSADDKSCVFDTCTAIQKLKVDGTCEDCQQFNRADETGKFCRPDTCGESVQILIEDGTCSSCQTFTHPDDDKRVCISDSCTATQILVEDGTCQQCEDFKRADETGRICMPEACNNINQILLVDGTCSTCGDYTRPDATNRQCIYDTCDYSTQIITLTGSCSTCDSYFRPDAADAAKNCIQDDCNTSQNEIHRSDGSCTSCSDYSYPSQYFNETSGQGICVTDTCDNSTQILLTNGTCSTCDDFKHPDNEALVCISDACTATQILIQDGKCQQCEGFKRADETGRICRPDICNVLNQILLVDGTCLACEDYTKPDSDQRVCVADECDTSIEILQPDGTCEKCSDYSHPDSVFRTCITDFCENDTQILLTNGKCQTCQDTRPDHENKVCIVDSCDAQTQVGSLSQKITEIGTCQICPPLTYPDAATQKTCVQSNCDQTTQILDATRECLTCPDYTHPDLLNEVCIKDSCDHSEGGGREFLNTLGKCEECPQYTYPKPVSDTYAETRECIFDSCDSWTQILQQSGRCSTCSPYSYPLGQTIRASRRLLQPSPPGGGLPTPASTPNVTPSGPQTSLPDPVEVSNLPPTQTNLPTVESQTPAPQPIALPSSSVARECVQVICNQERDVIDEQRQCQTCADYFYPDALGQSCIQETCTTISQIILSSGKCQDCPEHTFPDGSNRECVQETCDHTFQILSSLGTCEDCQPYSYPNNSTLDIDPVPKKCIELGCNAATDIMTKTAPHACQTCAEYSYPNEAGDQCLTDQCDNRSQILGINGKCSDCAEYTYPNGQNLQCISDQCDFSKQVLNKQGSCTTCAPYQYSGGDNRTCVDAACNTRSQFLNSNNGCETCSDYSYPSSNGTICQTDRCNTTVEVVAKTGKCLACGDFTYPNPDDTSNHECISDSCTDDQTLKSNGRCVLKSQLFAQDNPNENAIRTSLRIEGNIADMQSDEAKETFKGKLGQSMGFDSKYIQIQSIYAGSIVVVYDLVADENLNTQQLAQASQDAFKSGAVEASIGTILDVSQKDSSGTELQIVRDGEVQQIPDIALVLTDSDVIISEVIVDPSSALGEYISTITTEDIKSFLCENYYITLLALNYKTDTKQLKFSGCEFIESDTQNEYVLHHFLNKQDKISEFKVKRSPFSTQEIMFQQTAEMAGVNVESQQFVSIDSDKSKDQSIQYPAIVEKEYTYTLFSTNKIQTFGSTYLPTDSQLHLRQEKTVKKEGNKTSIVFFNELGDMHPQYYSSVKRQGTTFGVDLKYDFVTKVHTDVYNTFYDAIFIFIVIFPVVGFTLAGIIFLVNIVYFYQHLTQLIHRRYKDAENWQVAQKYLKKFRKIHSALEGMEPYAHIVTELESYINIEWEKCTYEETILSTQKMKSLDSMLPNLDDLEINLSKFTMSEAEKAKQSEIEVIMKKRTQLSVIDILDLVKKRVSIFGVYQLYDDLEMKDANLQSEIKISNAKLEFLYRTLDRKTHRSKRRTPREKTK